MKSKTLVVVSVLVVLLICPEIHAQFTPPKILKHPGKIRVERMSILNSTYRETNLNISPDGKYLFFMSGRGQMPWSNPFHTTYKGRPEHDGDIWYSTKYGSKWSYPKCLPSTVNTSSGEDEPNISPDGQTVVFQSWKRTWKLTGGPYYQSNLRGSLWGIPRGLGGGITKFFMDREKSLGQKYMATDGATLSSDGKTFIVATGPYQGNMDLYISRKKNGYWSYPKRLSISTMGDERSPFLAADGKTLYFASDGYGGWGGLDIHKTSINANDSHGKIVNLGSPFNTWLDDYGLIIVSSGEEAYFVREGDIYFADTKDANPELKPETSTLMIAGKVTDAKTKKATLANVVIKDAKTGKVIVRKQTNASTGEYAIVLPNSATNFIQEFTKTGFQNISKNFNISLKTGLNKVESDAVLAPIQAQVAVVDISKKENKPTEAAADMGIEENYFK